MVPEEFRPQVSQRLRKEIKWHLLFTFIEGFSLLANGEHKLGVQRDPIKIFCTCGKEWFFRVR